MSKIFYNGYYGYGNVGDNSFMEVAAWGARNIWEIDKVFFHTPKNSLLPILQTKSSFYKDLLFKGNYRVQKHFQLKTSKYFVSAGGSIFCNSINKNDIKAEFLKYRTQKIRGAIGVSVGPFSSKKDETSITSYLQTLDFLAVRDHRSFEICKSMQLPFKPILAADLAALLPETYSNARQTNEKDNKKIKRIGISYCRYESYIGGDIQKQTVRENQLIQIINELLKETEVEINFLIYNNHPFIGDIQPTKQIIEQLMPIRPNQIHIIPYQNNVFTNWEIIKNIDLVICTRLHAAIFSCFSNTPFIMMNYHAKCSDFGDDLGVQNKYQINIQDFNLKEVIFTVWDILFRNYYIAPINKENAKKRALLNFESVKEFFN